jgi:hypothetical protein
MREAIRHVATHVRVVRMAGDAPGVLGPQIAQNTGVQFNGFRHIFKKMLVTSC